MSKTILIIDDDEAIREMLQMAVEMEGFSAGTASNGLEGIEWLRKSDAPCLILLDLMMPVMNGWDFLKALESDPALSKLDIPIVMVTAFIFDETHPRLKGILQKPISVEQLYKTINEHCHCSK